VYSGSSASTPTKTLVLHFPTLHFGVYDYATDIDALVPCFNNRYYLCAGGHSDGRFYYLDSGTTDLSGGAATAVTAYIITRDEFLNYSEGTRQRLISVWAESQGEGGNLEVDMYPDGSTTPQPVGEMSLINKGKIFKVFQKVLKLFSGQRSVKFRIQNKSTNARMNLIGRSVGVDKDSSHE
jgi:hypothetical protein